MSKPQTVRLGFEVGTGTPVDIPLRHMVVSGQTQEAGKTTTLEALITRAGRPAVAFITKRGEGSFKDARRMPPYFRERADWQFVAAVLEASLGEKLKFERAWIMKATKGARTLAEVQANVQELQKTARGLSADMYMQLDNYLEALVPRIAAIDWAKSIRVAKGINVMDLADRERFPIELQGLVIRSALEWVEQRCEDTITLLPEAWEFLPQGRGSPVKLAAEVLIRKGAGLGNLVWFDSQDIGGIDKGMLRHCTVWLLGVQREANEIERTLANIPAGVKKPSKQDIALLQKGQFFACWGAHVFKVYVQPAWMSEADAIAVATGKKLLAIGGPMDPAILELVNQPGRLEEVEPTITERDLTEARQQGFREGFERGYSAGTSSVQGKITGVINAGNQFMELLRDMGSELGKQEAYDALMRDPPPRPKAPVVDLASTRQARAARPQATRAPGLLSAAADRLLKALSRYPAGLSWKDACIVCGMAYGNGFYYGGRKELLEGGLVQEHDDRASLTMAGRTRVGIPGRQLLRAEMIAIWSAKLKAPAPQMLQLLQKDPTRHWSTEAFGEALSIKPGNGHWYGGLAALREHSLIAPDFPIRLSTFLAQADA